MGAKPLSISQRQVTAILKGAEKAGQVSRDRRREGQGPVSSSGQAPGQDRRLTRSRAGISDGRDDPPSPAIPVA